MHGLRLKAAKGRKAADPPRHPASRALTPEELQQYQVWSGFTFRCGRQTWVRALRTAMDSHRRAEVPLL